MVAELLVTGCNAVNGSAHLKKIRTWPRNWRIQWGRWDCKSKEVIVGIVCH